MRRSRRTTGRIAAPSKTRSRAAVAAGEAVLHVSAHSFTPVLRGEVRNCDVGFLYDRGAAAKCGSSKRGMPRSVPLRRRSSLRRNYPYRGVSDALVTHLRRRYGARGYVGMELEVNQKHVGSRGWRSLVAVLAATLATAVD